MTPEQFLEWIDEKIEITYDAEKKEISNNPNFWRGMKMAFIEVKEKYLSIISPPQSTN